MTYLMYVSDSCEKSIEKSCKKNSLLRQRLRNKMKEILQNPKHYKPLRHDLKGERRIHIMKSFVLKYEIDEENKIVKFIFFGHHDEAYEI